MRTEHLVFSPWSETDWLALKPIATDPEVMRYINEGLPWPDDRIQEFVERQMACLRDRGYCMWKLLEPETDQMIGFCGLQPLANTPDIEIGWCWPARTGAVAWQLKPPAPPYATASSAPASIES